MERLIYSTINILLTIIFLAIVIRVILSWIGPDVRDPRWRKILQIIYSITEPILAPLRRLIPTISFQNMKMDLSPIAAMLAIRIIQGLVRNFLSTLLL